MNGRTFSPDIFGQALKEAKGSSAPIHLIVQSDTYVYSVDLNYHDGEKYPKLERAEGTPALLDDILKPMTNVQAIPTEKKP